MSRYFFSAVIWLVLFFSIATAGGYCRGTEVKGNVAVFLKPQRGMKLTALGIESRVRVNEMLNSLGRFVPVETNRISRSLERSSLIRSGNVYKKAAVELGADLYIVLSVFYDDYSIAGIMEVVPLTREYASIAGKVTVRSNIFMNIPAKLARELAYMHRGLPVRGTILEKRGDRSVISAGQFHGLAERSYAVTDGGRMKVLRVQRYRSLVKGVSGLKQGQEFEIPLYPKTGKLIRSLEKELHTNAVFKYKIRIAEKNDSFAEQRFVQALALINPGGNLLLPGYGAYLSTGYIGLKAKKADIPGAVLTAGLVVTHFCLPSFMTEFKVHFAPWVQDSDKTWYMQDLQIFLWASLPVTYTVSFLDQLAAQYKKLGKLPPFFLRKDTAALAFSAVIPGGGLFYKGRRIMGWGFYLSEMTLAVLGIYNRYSRKKTLYLFSTLGAVKMVELITAFFIKPSYNFYSYELQRGVSGSSLDFGIRGDEYGAPVFSASLIYRF